jgi:hypothetical protein
MKHVPAEQVMQHIGRILVRYWATSFVHQTWATLSQNCLGGYVLALDMTCRDWQNDAKKQGHPWFLAKSFDTSCPVGDLIESSQIPVRSTTIFGEHFKSVILVFAGSTQCASPLLDQRQTQTGRLYWRSDLHNSANACLRYKVSNIWADF